MKIAAAIAGLVLGIGLSHQAEAQTCPPGELRVIVKDSLATPVFDVRVRLTSGSVDIAPRQTPAMGVAEFEKLACGEWTVLASKAGFEDAAKTVQIGANSSVEVDLVLNPGIAHSSIDVTASAPKVEQSASQNYELHPAEVKTLPSNPATVGDALPLVPGVVRSPDGELKMDGSGENRSSLVVNQSDVTDPATGRFGQTLPIDSIETLNVLNTPFLAQYGRFTQSVVAVETKRGGDEWHADLNDPFPDFRIRSYHMRGIRNETPRASAGGPLIHDRLYFITALLYFLDKASSRTLPYPFNESKQQRYNSFTQVDYIASPRQIINATLQISPEHVNFVNPDYFNPQPVTPAYAQHTYIGTAAYHLGLLGGTLDSSLAIQRFQTFVGAQGDGDMTIAPGGNSGYFFGGQNRDAGRKEWLEIWSPTPVKLAGTHLLKIGSSFTTSNNTGRFSYRPVNIVSAAGNLLERIDFTNPPPFNRSDLETTAYVQDHWSPNARISFDFGARIEHQRLAQSLRIAPRAGVAWTPFADGRTVLRAGYGQFYDHIPLDVYTFGRYPNRTITDYAPDGSVMGDPAQVVDVIGSITGPRSFLIRGQQVAGAFSPRGGTWNVQAEHSFSRLLRARAVYTDNRSVGLIVFEPAVLNSTREIVLNGDGNSRFRQLELTAKLGWQGDRQMVLSYTHSRAEGSLNGFDGFLGNFPNPVVRAPLYGNLPGDLPNRFLGWGHVKLLRGFEIMPTVEYRSGFPYAAVDARQNYVGIPFGDETRYRHFFSADARLMRDFKVSAKYVVRLSVTGFNLTNHFNPLAVHSNVADSQYGVFFGNYHRRYRFDFEVVF